jgi:hypothetical protein
MNRVVNDCLIPVLEMISIIDNPFLITKPQQKIGVNHYLFCQPKMILAKGSSFFFYLKLQYHSEALSPKKWFFISD